MILLSEKKEKKEGIIYLFILFLIIALLSQVPAFFSFPSSPNDCPQMFPTMYPALAPGLIPSQNQEQMNHGAGIYAVPVLPFMGHIAGFPPNTLIPLTYNLPR